MTDLAVAFEQHRSHLRGVAYRMLGSGSEADDAVQEAWLKLARADTSAVENLRGWLTTVVARVCLDMLRSRTSRREESLATAPEPTVGAPDRELADSVGIAVLVVLDKLDPAERLAFVLHDLFAMPFDEIGPLVGRSTAAARQLASRARRRVQGASAPEVELATQRRVVDAFIAAIRSGDMEAMVAVLDPDVVARVDGEPDEARRFRQVRGHDRGQRNDPRPERFDGVDSKKRVAVFGDEDRVDDEVSNAGLLDRSGDRQNDLGRGEHPRLGGVDPDVGGYRKDLRGDDVGRNIGDPAHSGGVLDGHRRDGAHAPHADGRERLQVGLDAGSPARVRAGNGQRPCGRRPLSRRVRQSGPTLSVR